MFSEREIKKYDYYVRSSYRMLIIACLIDIVVGGFLTVIILSGKPPTAGGDFISLLILLGFALWSLFLYVRALLRITYTNGALSVIDKFKEKIEYPDTNHTRQIAMHAKGMQRWWWILFVASFVASFIPFASVLLSIYCLFFWWVHSSRYRRMRSFNTEMEYE